MSDLISCYRGPVPDLIPGRFGVSALWQGFALEGHEIPAGDWGDSEFRCHFVAIELGSDPYDLHWKENGVHRVVRVEPGTAFVRSQQPLCSLRLSGTQRCLMLSIDPDAMELALPEPFLRRPIELIAKPIGQDPVVRHLIAALQSALVMNEPAQSLLFGSLGNSLALYLATQYATQPLRLVPKAWGLSRERLARVREYIHENMAGELGLQELAAVACLSTYHFGRMFKASTGQTVHQFVLHERIERSKELLRRTDASLAEISAAAGFSSQSQFTTTFRRITGITPGTWRAALK